MESVALSIPCTELASFARRWRVIELALFGSALTDSFGPQSDVDILVTFAPGAEWSLLDHVQMQEQLTRLFGRPVDLVTKKAVMRSANWLRRQAILNSAQVIYAEQG
jgi:predicted nucleotidyltransferase